MQRTPAELGEEATKKHSLHLFGRGLFPPQDSVADRFQYLLPYHGIPINLTFGGNAQRLMHSSCAPYQPQRVSRVCCMISNESLPRRITATHGNAGWTVIFDCIEVSHRNGTTPSSSLSLIIYLMRFRGRASDYIRDRLKFAWTRSAVIAHAALADVFAVFVSSAILTGFTIPPYP